MQVAVAFPYKSAFVAIGNQGRLTLKGAAGPLLQIVELKQEGVIVNHRADLVEVFLHCSEDRFWRSQWFAGFNRWLAVVEVRGLPGEAGEQFRREFAVFLSHVEQLVLVELAHADGVLERVPLATECRSLGRAGDGQHVEV